MHQNHHFLLRIGKDAVSCQRERNQKVDAEIPELGSGIESADCPLWRTAYRLSVKEKQEWGALLSPSFLLSVYSFGIYIIARNFRSYSRGRVWAEPTKGNTVSTKIYSTAKFYISISYLRILLTILLSTLLTVY